MAAPAGMLKCPIDKLIEIMYSLRDIPSRFDMMETFMNVLPEHHTTVLYDVIKASAPPQQLLRIMADVYVFGYRDRSKMTRSFMGAVEDIEVLAYGFLRSFLHKPGSSSVDRFPDAKPSKTEMYRIRRAF